MIMTPGFFENLLDICPEGVVGNDLEGNVVFFNPSAERILGYSREEVIGKIRVSAFYPKGGAREVKEFIFSEEFGGRGRLAGFETDLVRKDGRRFPSSLSCVVLTEGGREVGVVGFFSDISARKAAERESLESEKRFRTIVETAGDAIFSFDEDHNIVMANRAAEEMLEYDKGGLSGMNFRRLIPSKYGDSWEQIERYAAAGGAQGPKRSVELTLLAKGGREIAVQISMAEKQAAGKKTVTAIVRDVSVRRAMEEELRLLSITDTLTQLYNRRHFHSLAGKELDRAQRTKVVFSLILMDIDNFKKYNDTYGHAEGDRVLQAMGEVMRKNFRTMDSCFRMGGEEFLVLLPEAGASGAMVAAERLRARFSRVEFHPLPGAGPVTMTVSIGVSEHHEGDTVEDTFRFADLAMYAAKSGGRNRCVNYEDLRGRTAEVSGASDFPA
jgi:diguanylate cyclase (GGDEF)-like protein/PAS domain S-box-containing protein